jgi:TolB-like protein
MKPILPSGAGPSAALPDMGRRRGLRSAAALGAAMVAVLGSSGCASYYYGSAAGATPVDLVGANYAAVDALLMQSPPLDPALPLMVATIVQIDRLSESSRLGRLVSEQLAGRLAQRGLRVTELKLRETLAMRSGQGALLLSGEAREVAQAQAAQAVLVGTYAASPRAVFISLKLVHPSGNVVLAAYDYALPMDATVRGLLMAQ